MDKEHRRAIQTNFVTLVESCNINTLLPLLISKGVFNEDIIKTCQSQKDEKDGKRRLFLNISRRGPEAFEKLILSLRESHQHSLADCLAPGEIQQFQENLSCKPFLLPDNGNLISSIEHAREIENSFCLNLRTEPLKVTVKPAENFMFFNDRPMYKTQSKNRGMALIINIVEYWNCDDYPYRNAAFVDDTNLKELFTQMGLKVKTLRNLVRSELEDEIKKFADDPQLNHVDIAVVVIMGHGSYQLNDTTVLASDGQEVEASWIEEQLNNYNCSYLKLKPKIIIYQVCRGPLKDYGTTHNIPRRTEQDSVTPKAIRTYSDMLIAHSTIPGFQSHRDPYTGSWYIELICEVFMKYAHNTDVQDLLSIVDDKLSQMRSEKMTQQTSSFTNIGFKKCFFHPGIYMENGQIKKFSDERNN